MPLTVNVWLKAVCRNRVLDRAEDTPRIREAFAMLAERSKRWPTPADFLASMPSNVVPFHARPKLESESNRQRGMKHIAEINKIIGYRPPRTDDNGPEAA